MRFRSLTLDQYQPKRFSTRSSSRYSYSDPSSGPNDLAPFSRLDLPIFQSIRSLQSTADTDFGSCQDLNGYDEVLLYFFLSSRYFAVPTSSLLTMYVMHS